jgi:hypothetical protein
MSPLSKETLQNILPDLQHLTNIWVNTAEALILERKIVERPQDIKRNSQVLLELIKEEGVGDVDPMDNWSTPTTNAHTEAQDAGAVSD